MLLAVAVMFSSALFAEPAALSLEQALSEAARANPELAAAAAAAQAAGRRPLQQATPMGPRVEIERMYSPTDRQPFDGAQERSVAITQELPFPTTLALKAKEARQSAAMAEERLRGKRLEIAARTRSTYAALWLVQRSLDILEENLSLMRRFSRVAESKFIAGHASQSDALKAQLELTRMLNMQLALAEEQAVSQAELAGLLGREDAAFGRLEDPPLPSSATLAGAEQSALSRSPELAESRLSAERSGTRLALARSEYLPSLMLQYRRRSGGAMLPRSHDGVLGFSLPLWFWRPAAMAAEAKAERAMAQAELGAARLDTMAAARRAAARLRASLRLGELYGNTVLPQAEAALRVAESSYQSNKTGFLDLLDAQRSFLAARLEQTQYRAQAQERLAELTRVTATEL